MAAYDNRGRMDVDSIGKGRERRVCRCSIEWENGGRRERLHPYPQNLIRRTLENRINEAASTMREIREQAEQYVPFQY